MLEGFPFGSFDLSSGSWGWHASSCACPAPLLQQRCLLAHAGEEFGSETTGFVSAFFSRPTHKPNSVEVDLTTVCMLYTIILVNPVLSSERYLLTFLMLIFDLQNRRMKNENHWRWYCKSKFTLVSIDSTNQTNSSNDSR